MKKATTLLIHYGFEIKKDSALLADGLGYGSMRFEYANSEEYAKNYTITCRNSLEKLKNDFRKQNPSTFSGTLNVTFTFFTCVHSMTEEIADSD